MAIFIPISLAVCHHRFCCFFLRGLGMQGRFCGIEPIFPGNARLAEPEHVVILDLMHAIGKVMADLGLQFQGQALKHFEFFRFEKSGLFDPPQMPQDGGELHVHLVQAAIRFQFSFKIGTSHYSSLWEWWLGWRLVLQHRRCPLVKVWACVSLASCFASGNEFSCRWRSSAGVGEHSRSLFRSKYEPWSCRLLLISEQALFRWQCNYSACCAPTQVSLLLAGWKNSSFVSNWTRDRKS